MNNKHNKLYLVFQDHHSPWMWPIRSLTNSGQRPFALTVTEDVRDHVWFCSPQLARWSAGPICLYIHKGIVTISFLVCTETHDVSQWSSLFIYFFIYLLSDLLSFWIWGMLYLISGEGNGNPLQYSCLENPRDRGAWWVAIFGVAQSWTWLKWLSSSSIPN